MVITMKAWINIGLMNRIESGLPRILEERRDMRAYLLPTNRSGQFHSALFHAALAITRCWADAAGWRLEFVLPITRFATPSINWVEQELLRNSQGNGEAEGKTEFRKLKSEGIRGLVAAKVQW